MAGVSLADATKEVARRDRVLAKAIARLGPLEHSVRDPDGPFVALPRA
jgi:DNA-3-methyladenine glycosylase II